MQDLLGLYYGLMVMGLIVGGLLAIRAIFKFLDWRDGDKDALWNFLALCCGATAGILVFIGFAVFNAGNNWTAWDLFSFSIYAGLVLILASLGLTAVSVILKWREVK